MEKIEPGKYVEMVYDLYVVEPDGSWGRLPSTTSWTKRVNRANVTTSWHQVFRAMWRATTRFSIRHAPDSPGC